MIRGVMRRALADLSAGLSVPARRDGVAAPPCIRSRKYLSHIAHHELCAHHGRLWNRERAILSAGCEHPIQAAFAA